MAPIFRNALNVLIAMAMVLSPVDRALSMQGRDCNKMLMTHDNMEISSVVMMARNNQVSKASCKHRQLQSQKTCNNDLCKCLAAVHVFIGTYAGLEHLDKPGHVYNERISIMETDFVIFPFLRPPIA